MLVIACAGILGWLLMLGIALGLAAAAKRGDELARAERRYLPDSHTGAQIIVLRPNRSGHDVAHRAPARESVTMSELALE